MANFKPSVYQQAVYDFIKDGKGNAVINAVAGSGKSTTIVNALSMIPNDKKVLFLAFNVDIKKELEAKVKKLKLSNVSVSTLHSLGFKTMLRVFKSNVRDDKYTSYFNERFNDKDDALFKQTRVLSEEDNSEYFANVRKLLDLLRVNLANKNQDIEDLVYKHNIRIVDNEIKLVGECINWGIQHPEMVDFTDMIYLPCLKKLHMPQYDFVFIDECQDLNTAQRTLFMSCVKEKVGRWIAVGDVRQAIYGFCGGDADSFNKLKSSPNTITLPLSICYRCDKNIIKLAQDIVPQIQWREGADEGVVDRNAKIEDVKSGDMILCRVTAPLVRLGMRYISQGIKANIKGRDIGINLINLIRKTKKKTMEGVLYNLELELEKIAHKVMERTHCNKEEAKESPLYQFHLDKIQSLKALSGDLKTPQAVINRIEKIFSDEQEGIILSTVHKSKGLEADRVFIICEDKLPLKWAMKVDWMAEQEWNLVYVTITRAKHFLGYIKDFE